MNISLFKKSIQKIIILTLPERSRRMFFCFFILIFLFSFIFLPSFFVQAKNINAQIMDGLTNSSKEAGYTTNNSTPTADIEKIIGTVIKTALTLVGAIFLILIIYAGFTWMTAGGNEEKIKKARGIIINASIGLAIVMLAYAIVYFITYELATATGYGI